MARILFVAKDNGCASVTEQVAVLARKDGHEVIVALEGLAMKRYETLGFVDKNLPNFWGYVDFRVPTEEEKKKVPPFNAVAYLEKVNPDIVVTGLGSPINIQAQIAGEAMFRRIPLVVCEDFWAKSVSHLPQGGVSPTMILTVDEYSVRLVVKAFPYISTIETVGNPGVKKVEIPETVQAQIRVLRAKYEKIYVYAGAGPDSTTAELNLLVRCLEKTGGNWCLVPRFHPKYDKLKLEGMKKPYGEIWREYLAPFSAHVRYVEASSTDPVAVAGDVVLSGFSTLLSTALWNGVPAVCLRTPETIASLKAHGSHYTEIPQVALGLAPAVTEPTDLSQFGMPSEEALRKLVPYDAALAYKHICRLL